MSAGDEIPPKLGLLRRLSRSSTKSPTEMFSPTGKASPGAVATTNDIATSLPAKGKIAALSRLKAQLGKRGRKEKVQFPPSSWHAEGDHEVPEASTPTTAPQEPSPEESAQSTTDSTSVEGSQPSACHNVEVDALPSSESLVDDSQSMSAATLAHRIQSLLSSLPPFYTLSPSGSVRLPKPPDQSEHDAPPVADSRLLSLLSSASAMNGSLSKGRESVWSILERLKYMPNVLSGSQESNKDESGPSGCDDNYEVSSVMICCPLEPTEDTEVEIARSEIVSIDFDDPNVENRPETPTEKKVGLNMWPFGKGKDKPDTPPQEPSSPAPKFKEVRVWFPSRTKVSLQAAWWGYRIYLPPPVMRVLSDKSLEAAKRAAMITAALSWLVSHIPTAMLPPQLRAVVGIVKGIVPLIGYLSGFIAWSWSTVQGFDKGQGVILSATWLLPIALVPGTWYYTDPPPGNNNISAGNGFTETSTFTPPAPPPKDPPAQPRPSPSAA